MLLGKKIDPNTLAALPEFAGKNPTPLDCGRYALASMENYQKLADENVNGMKDEYGDGVSTLVMIYNASGRDVIINSLDNKYGRIGDWPYDPVIANGQWSVFLHVKKTSAASGSQATLGCAVDAVPGTLSISWDTPWAAGSTNTASVSADHDALKAAVDWQCNITQGSSGKALYVLKAKP
jgi:hypothetical protein